MREAPQGPTRAAVLSGAANVAIFVSAPQFYCFAVNAPLRFCICNPAFVFLSMNLCFCCRFDFCNRDSFSEVWMQLHVLFGTEFSIFKPYCFKDLRCQEADEFPAVKILPQ